MARNIYSKVYQQYDWAHDFIFKGRTSRVAEGWMINDGRIGKANKAALEKTKLMSAPLDRFKTDEEAVAFVNKKAKEGSEYHRKAVIFCSAYKFFESQ